MIHTTASEDTPWSLSPSLPCCSLQPALRPECWSSAVLLPQLWHSELLSTFKEACPMCTIKTEPLHPLAQQFSTGVGCGPSDTG